MIDIFRRLFVVAALAGLISGVFITFVHEISTTPVILAAEVYESAGDAVPDPAAAAAHDAPAWEPEPGFERTAFTLMANVLTGIGFALLLVSAYSARGRAVDWQAGLYWGLAGFAVFTLVPDLGLPPELPGTQAAPLFARQIWWVATALLSAGGLALIFLGRKAVAALLGVVLIVLPHVWGAPQPAEHVALAPESLSHRFIVATTVASLLFWAALGAVSGFLYGRVFRRAA